MRIVLTPFAEHYKGAPRNSGLVLKVVPDERGWLMEILRADETDLMRRVQSVIAREVAYLKRLTKAAVSYNAGYIFRAGALTKQSFCGGLCGL